MIPGADKLIPEVMQHYPNEPVNAMNYLIEEYQIDVMEASHLVSVIWSHLDMSYPTNLPTFLVNPYGIHKN